MTLKLCLRCGERTVSQIRKCCYACHTELKKSGGLAVLKVPVGALLEIIDQRLTQLRADPDRALNADSYKGRRWAEYFGVDYRTIHRMTEAGTCTPKTADTICTALGYHPIQVFGSDWDTLYDLPIPVAA